jgi:hypothetical protein
MLVLIDIEPAIGTDVVLIKPRLDAIYVEMVVALKEEDFVPFPIHLQTNGAHLLRIHLCNCPNWNLLEHIFFDSILFFYFFSHIIILHNL